MLARRYSVRSSAIFLVSVVTRTRSSRSVRSFDELEQVVDLTFGRLDDVTSGSTRPVGRMICSTTWLGLTLSISQSPGVADRNHFTWLRRSIIPRTAAADCRRGRQTEAVLDQRVLAGTVTLVLAVELGHRHVRLVDHAQRKSLGK